MSAAELGSEPVRPEAMLVEHPVDATRQPLVAVDVGRLRRICARDVVLRFAFGAGVSLVAGLVTVLFGPRVGGLFLAFPAILPAALTLLEGKDGPEAPLEAVRGAVLGATALVAFALVAGAALGALPVVPALSLALGAWVVVAVGLYFVIETARRGRDRSRGRPAGGPGAPPPA